MPFVESPVVARYNFLPVRIAGYPKIWPKEYPDPAVPRFARNLVAFVNSVHSFTLLLGVGEKYQRESFVKVLSKIEKRKLKGVRGLMGGRGVKIKG